MQDAARTACMPRVTMRHGRRTRVTLEGHTFYSLNEYLCFAWLERRRAAGEVAWFIRDAAFELSEWSTHRATFLAVLTGGGVEVWDAFDEDKPVNPQRRKQVMARFGVEVRIWKREAMSA